ncbi:MAG: peptidase [Paenibacillus sp.]|nr:peptidase [Paenibacillus sp.]
MSMPYVVKPGDTWFRLAERAELTLEELTARNRSMHPDPAHYLVPGQIVFVPSALKPQEVFTRRNSTGPLVNTSAPYGYMELMGDIQHFLIRYPFIQVEWIGHSVMERPIPVLRIGIGACEVHFNGSFHANEWITSLVLMKFLERLAEAVSGGRESMNSEARMMKELYEKVSLWIVPMVNPDGVELVHCGVWPGHPHGKRLLKWNKGKMDFTGWKANIQGVDLNDQFPAYWEEECARRRPSAPQPGPRDYTGSGPLTEPEAKAMAAFTRSRNFQMAVAFHTQGEEIYWNYRGMEPAISKRMADKLAKASGYQAVKLAGSDAGYKDWFIQQFRRPGFTIEAGQGINPLPIEQFDSLYGKIEPLMVEAMRLAEEYSTFPNPS